MASENNKNATLRVISILVVILLIAVMAWLTYTEEDPCASPQADISGAVLADPDGDQDALVNRAIIIKGKCKKE
jgi:hypothetical protein